MISSIAAVVIGAYWLIKTPDSHASMTTSPVSATSVEKQPTALVNAPTKQSKQQKSSQKSTMIVTKHAAKEEFEISADELAMIEASSSKPGTQPNVRMDDTPAPVPMTEAQMQEMDKMMLAEMNATNSTDEPAEQAQAESIMEISDDELAMIDATANMPQSDEPAPKPEPMTEAEFQEMDRMMLAQMPAEQTTDQPEVPEMDIDIDEINQIEKETK